MNISIGTQKAEACKQEKGFCDGPLLSGSVFVFRFRGFTLYPVNYADTEYSAEVKTRPSRVESLEIPNDGVTSAGVSFKVVVNDHRFEGIDISLHDEKGNEIKNVPVYVRDFNGKKFAHIDDFKDGLNPDLNYTLTAVAISAYNVESIPFAKLYVLFFSLFL